MFVPDEEAARGIEVWDLAVSAARAPGIWPGWPPSGAVFGLILPGGAGLCLAGAGEAIGRPVAARRGGALAGVRHLSWEDVRSLGGQRPERETPVTLSLEGLPVHAVAVADPAEMARALATLAFGRWWSGRRRDADGADPPPPAPDPSPDRAALATVEGRLLLLALEGHDVGPLALQVALVRRERRASLDDAEVTAEERWEIDEGLPAYVGERAAAVLSLRPLAESAWGAELRELGRLPASRRARLTGWALAHLLDRIEAGAAPAVGPTRPRPWVQRPTFPEGWKAALDGGRAEGLSVLLESHVRFDGGSRDDAALARALAITGHAEALQAAQARAAEAAAARQALMDGILRGRGTLVVVEVTALGAPEVQAPVPAQSIHAGMAVYPQGATFRYAGGTRLRFDGLPLAEDRRSGLLQARVAARLALQGDGAAMRPDEEAVFEEGLHLRVPGLEVQARTGVIRPIDGGYLIRLLR